MNNNETVTEKLAVNENWCKGCGICVKFCPKCTNSRERKS